MSNAANFTAKAATSLCVSTADRNSAAETVEVKASVFMTEGGTHASNVGVQVSACTSGAVRSVSFVQVHRSAFMDENVLPASSVTLAASVSITTFSKNATVAAKSDIWNWNVTEKRTRESGLRSRHCWPCVGCK